MIIESLLDTDLYKLTMMQGVLHQFPWADVEYEFKCRDPDIDLLPLCDVVSQEIDHLCTLRFQREELDYLRELRFIKEDFVQFLRLFQLNREFIHISEEDGRFALRIHGPWLHTILFEVPVLAIINECYFRDLRPEPDYDLGRRKLRDKIAAVNETEGASLGFGFSDFGTRRRYSKAWQDEILSVLKRELPNNLRGSSNVLLAKKHDLIPIGTMAHEWLMAAQSLGPKLANSQKFALEHWAQEYRGDLGIALSDVVGFDAFLGDFDMYFAKLFDGCRQDSGDPFLWGDKLVAQYQRHRIDPMTKVAVFSDALTFPKAIEIARYFKNRIRVSFGIGTNLTNDISERPIQIVIKMTQCQGTPVAKISDTPSKQMCRDEEYLGYLKTVFHADRAAKC